MGQSQEDGTVSRIYQVILEKSQPNGTTSWFNSIKFGWLICIYAVRSIRVMPPRVETNLEVNRSSFFYKWETLAVSSRSQSKWPRAVWSQPVPSRSYRIISSCSCGNSVPPSLIRTMAWWQLELPPLPSPLVDRRLWNCRGKRSGVGSVLVNPHRSTFRVYFDQLFVGEC